MFEFSGCAAAITGAASGIGRALAIELAARGCDLALADIDPGGLRVLADEVRSGFDSVDRDQLVAGFDQLARTTPAQA